MRKIKLIPTVFLLIFTAIQCTYDNEEEYFAVNTTSCDTLNVSFTSTILPIMEANCFACHNSTDRTAGITLDNYAEVKATVLTGRFLGAIKHEKGFSNMPRSAAKLDDCTINQIEAWINQGMIEN
ncbi:MAG: hypothetical protein ACERKD_09685 [Prolixibacteraceae bacterium]